jgi:hypothetical protein
MRGFPPIQIFLLGLLFGLLAIPLVQLTGQAVSTHGGDERSAQSKNDSPDEVPSASSSPSDEGQKTAILVRVRYAHKPLKISLKDAARELLIQPDLSASPLEVESQLLIRQEGNELSLEAIWPENTPDTALTVEIEPDGREARRETVWSRGADLSEILTFIW